MFLLSDFTVVHNTVLFSFITKSSAERGQRTLILTHRAEILSQIHRTLDNVGVPHSTLQAGQPTPRNAQTVVASIGTLVRRLDQFPEPDLMVVDEAHHSAAGTWVRVFGAWPKCRVLGVTATPERLDGKGLGLFYDRLVRGPEVTWLIENGFLARPRYFSPETVVDTASLHHVAGDFNRAESAALMDKPTITGDAVQQYQRLAAGKRAVVFCVSVAHAQHVAQQFNAAGIPAETIDGTMDDDERSAIIGRLSAGTTLVLCSCELISEGFDLPVVDAAILLRPTESLAMHLQQVGRCLRPHPAKEHALILDHVGNCLRHGLAEEPRDWSLEGGAGKRRNAKDPVIATRRCEKCFAIFVGPACPQCKAPYESKTRDIRQVDGQLREISPEDIVKLRAKAAIRAEIRAARSYEDFIQIGKKHGFKRGWAWFRWNNSWQKKAMKV